MISINDYIKLFTFKIVIEFYVYDTFFINCTDLVEITLHERNNCFTDSNPRRLTVKIYFPLLIARFCREDLYHP